MDVDEDESTVKPKIKPKPVKSIPIKTEQKEPTCSSLFNNVSEVIKTFFTVMCTVCFMRCCLHIFIRAASRAVGAVGTLVPTPSLKPHIAPTTFGTFNHKESYRYLTRFPNFQGASPQSPTLDQPPPLTMLCNPFSITSLNYIINYYCLHCIFYFFNCFESA